MTREQDLVLRLCQVARAVNSLIDSREHLHILETRRHILDGDLFAWLGNRFPPMGLELWCIPVLHQAEIAEMFEDMATIRLEGKYGITSNGLNLLAAYAIEAIQVLARP